VLHPGESGFAEAHKLFNTRWAHRLPALIAQPLDADDVATVMKYASANGIPVAVRGGGHGADGTAMAGGALVLDLSKIRDVTVDPDTNRVRAGGGALLGDLDAATQAHGLAVPSGTVSTTGIAGLALGGGVGYLMRRFGATVDNLLGCDVVTVDGRKVRASATENADLFWALRGGGGNFGVVTEFEFQGHEVGPDVVAGFIVLTFDQAESMFAKLREHMKTAPRELGLIAALAPCPPMPPLPAELYGKPAMLLVTVYTGPVADAGPVIAAIEQLGKPAAVLVGPMPWTQANRMVDVVAPYGRRMHSRGGYLSSLSDRAIRSLTQWAANAPAPSSPGPSTSQNIWFFGGAISEDFAEESAAFSRENAAAFFEFVGQWDGAEHDGSFVAWVDGAADALAPDMLASGYSNLTTDRGPAWLRGLFGKPEKYRRLVEAKTKWDPKNLLRFNKNIIPE
jgi:hypothetical protein